MAGPITKSELKELPLLDYTQLRATLRSGDLLFAAGNHMISKAIQKVTDSPWSHVGIVFNVASIDRVLLLESVEDQGVRFAPLSKYLHDYERGRPYDGIVAIGRCEGVNTTVIEELSRSGIDHLTMSYDKDEIAKILARVAMGKGRHKRDREYICSELVHECFLEAGVDFKKDRRGFVSPRNIWADEKVSLIGRIL